MDNFSRPQIPQFPGNTTAPSTARPSTSSTNQGQGRQQRQRPRRAANRNNLRSREGFFMHYLFITLSIRYASYFKPTARRLIEFFTLIKAILMLLLLIYIHSTFVKETGNCLDHVEDIWPRAGVLKVQVEANTSLPPYHFYFVKKNIEDWAASFQTYPHQAIFKYSAQLGKDGLPVVHATGNVTRSKSKTPNNAEERARKILRIPSKDHCPAFNVTIQMMERAQKLMMERFAKIVPEIEFLHAQGEEEIPHWIMVDPSISDTEAELKMLQMQEVSGFSVGPQPVRAYYAIEYSTEFGYLRLSALTRHKMGIPVLVVTLDPTKNECFGNGVKRWMLDTFFGYDDLVMGSIKHLAEKGNKQGGGYLRNLVTGEHYKFITLWVSHASYLLAFAVMLVFTLVVTMLLRYSYHQIFVFMVELLHILDTDATPVFPAAPMLTIILALVGTEEIMTEFFHDSTLAFYVILSIWVADQFDAICMHTIVSRRYWVRFFFLYHFAFYAYHYRFNGQFSELALFTSWLFIQHSMFYFFHHYELPAIQRQIRLRQVLLQSNAQNTSGSSGRGGGPPAGDSNPGTSVDPDRPSDSQNNNEPGTATQEAEPPTTNASEEPVPEQPGPSAVAECAQVGGMCVPAIDIGKYDVPVRVDDEPVERAEDKQLSVPEVRESLMMIKDDAAEEESDKEMPGCIHRIHATKDVSETVMDCLHANRSELWADDLKLVFDDDNVETIEADLGQTSVGFFKYCNLIILLFFALAALLLIFAFAVILLNQGRMGARFGMQDFNDVAKIVR